MSQNEYEKLIESTQDKNRPTCEGWDGERTHDAKGEPIPYQRAILNSRSHGRVSDFTGGGRRILTCAKGEEVYIG